MRTPDPRGLPPQSFTATVCDRFEDSFKGKRPPAVPINFDTLFPPAPKMRDRIPPPPPPRLPRLTATLHYEEKKLMLPTGNKILRKKGKHAGQLVDERVMVMLVTVYADVGGKFFFRVTSGKSTTVFDSRTKSRRAIPEVRAELLRLCGSDAAADELAAHLAKPKEAKPREIKPIANFQPPRGSENFRPVNHWRDQRRMREAQACITATR